MTEQHESEMILQVKSLTRQFGGLTAVSDVNIDVRRRSIHALIGPNGAGKTTTLSMINGTLKPTKGKIVFDGQDVTDWSTDKIARAGIGRTFQNIKLFPSMTVLQNLMVGGHSRYTKGGLVRFLLNINESNFLEKELRERAEEVANEIGIYHLKDMEVGGLAYGRQKICEFGRALMLEPKLILLDEPAAGLNPTERSEFIDMLQKAYDDGIDLFLIEHNMDVVMNISHQITVLNFGVKIAEGTPSEIQNNADVVKAYLGSDYTVQE